VAVEAQRCIVGVLVVMEPAKIRAGGIGSVDGMVGQNMISFEMSDERRAINRTTIEQFTDTQCFGFPPSTDWDAGQVRCSPGLLEFRDRVWRTGPVLA
jgi:hypothetical protein